MDNFSENLVNMESTETEVFQKTLYMDPFVNIATAAFQ